MGIKTATSAAADEDAEWLAILAHNGGFPSPERWVGLARRERFRKVSADRVGCCPDCGAGGSEPLFQYVHYSHLIRMRNCAACGLWYCDTLIDPREVRELFECKYKDERYFLSHRRRITREITRLLAAQCPRDSEVIDIGGAQGHLMDALRRSRPDLKITVSDFSRNACDVAADRFRFTALCRGLAEMEGMENRFDAVVLSDVLYYEAHLRRAWENLAAMTRPGGLLLLRLPNKLALIRAGQFTQRLFLPASKRALLSNAPFFNSEHLFIFSRSYLERRLRAAGFRDIRFLPSELLVGHRPGYIVCSFLFGLASLAHSVTGGRVVLTPSLLVTARRQ